MTVEDQWYRQESSEDAARLLIAEAQRAIQDNAPRYLSCSAYASLFEGCQLSGFTAQAYASYADPIAETGEGTLIKNTARSIAMTQVALLAANDNPLSQFMANSGGWQESVKAVRMGRLVDAEVEQPQGQFASLHEMHRHGVMLATAVTGSYMVFFFPGDDGVRCELDDTLLVRIDQSGRFGRITGLTRTVWRDADELISEFPDLEQEILEAEESCNDRSIYLADTSQERYFRPERGVCVVQGWRTKYREMVGREMWVLQKSSTVLKDVDFDRQQGPWVKWDYERSLYGVWGTSCTQQIYEMAVRENRMLCDADNAERNSPQCLLVLPENAEREGDLDEARGWTIIRSNVPANQFNFVTPPKYNEQSMAFADRMAQGCQEISGVAQQHSSAARQPGTTSGKHEHLVAALHPERFADQGRRLIQCRTVDTARRIVEALEDLLKVRPEYSRVWSKDDRTEEIKAQDLDLDASKYTISIAPVSEEKNSPKARLEKAYGWLEQQLITGSEFASIQQTFATQEKSQSLLAQEQWIERQIDKWLHADDEARQEENFYQGPDEGIDLPSALRQVKLAQLQARSRNAPPEVLDLFDKFLSETSDYMDRSAAQQQTQITADAADAGGIFPGISDAAPQPQPGAPLG